MIYSGNIRKMRTNLGNEVQYTLPLYDNLQQKHYPIDKSDA